MTSQPSRTGSTATEPRLDRRTALQQAMAENGFAYQQQDGSFDLPLSDVDGVFVRLNSRGFTVEPAASPSVTEPETPAAPGHGMSWTWIPAVETWLPLCCDGGEDYCPNRGYRCCQPWCQHFAPAPPEAAALAARPAEAQAGAGIDAERLAQIIAAAEGFPGRPSLKNRELADYIATEYLASLPTEPEAER